MQSSELILLSRQYNNLDGAGEGYAVGGAGDDINGLSGEIGGELVHAAGVAGPRATAEHAGFDGAAGGDVAVYRTVRGLTLVAEREGGPWAVDVASLR